MHRLLSTAADRDGGHLDRSRDDQSCDQRRDLHLMRDMFAGGCSDFELAGSRSHQGCEGWRPSLDAHWAISPGEGPFTSVVHRSSISNHGDWPARSSRSHRRSSCPCSDSPTYQRRKTIAKGRRRSPLGSPSDSQGWRLPCKAPNCGSGERACLGSSHSCQLSGEKPPIALVGATRPSAFDSGDRPTCRLLSRRRIGRRSAFGFLISCSRASISRRCTGHCPQVLRSSRKGGTEYRKGAQCAFRFVPPCASIRSEEHTSELQSQSN